DNHGNRQTQVQRVRGSIHPQYGGERGAPCPGAGLTDAPVGVVAAAHGSPEEERGGRGLLSSAVGCGSSARASTCRRKDRGPTRSASTRTETETECSGTPWKAGT